ncbi:hypothetical protein BDZ97DRAFT_1753631 [Flammula alnicola]|nr:hypothetical protein BDZ97DRAFT_1753631 [Flammula alnicola]
MPDAVLSALLVHCTVPSISELPFSFTAQLKRPEAIVYNGCHKYSISLSAPPYDLESVMRNFFSAVYRFLRQIQRKSAQKSSLVDFVLAWAGITVLQNALKRSASWTELQSDKSARCSEGRSAVVAQWDAVAFKFLPFVINFTQRREYGDILDWAEIFSYVILPATPLPSVFL